MNVPGTISEALWQKGFASVPGTISEALWQKGFASVPGTISEALRQKGYASVPGTGLFGYFSSTIYIIWVEFRVYLSKYCKNT
ncbi:hypothetical protein [Pseudalkalibacillus salsuginis]|uniref:hypothetical protein n=1 Tax=Pseudalkalibacillus salsuginis TaxID=2910972 RepID=UPI001F45DE57|nr:hypothetical protein [Pseudalkalibacillus salsuginis]MCF6411306.1 hypothetical protein [Pseudalkalibacillus salsuginis]